MRQRRSGFTLIELLVVIAIIAILAAMLFPLFVRMKIAANQARCVSNIGQIAKGMMIYASDHGGRIPRWQDRINGLTWDTYIFRYVKNARVFTCPINCVKSDKTPYPAGVFIRSYSMPKNISGVLYETAPRPTMTVLLFEKGASEVGVPSDAVAEYYDQTFGAANEPPEKFWHGPGKVFAFFDGHAKYLPYPKGPFDYYFRSFPGWSNQPSADPPTSRHGYCGYQDTTGTGDPKGASLIVGSNIPQ